MGKRIAIIIVLAIAAAAILLPFLGPPLFGSGGDPEPRALNENAAR